MKIVIWLGVLLLALLLWLNTPDGFWAYAFHLRVPLLAGVLLIALPILAVTGLRAMLRNLFVLRGKWQMAFVITSAVMAGTSVVLVATIIVRNAPARFGAPPWTSLPEVWQYILAIGLALPVCITAIVLSKERIDISADASLEREKPKRRARWTGVALGVVLSIVLLVVARWMRLWLVENAPLQSLSLQAITFFTKQQTQGYIDPQTGELASGHLTALAYFAIGLAVYGFIAWRFQPKPRSHRAEAPALLYVMFLVAGTAVLFGGLTFFFDFYQILPLLLVVAGSAASYALFNVNHFFNMVPLQAPLPEDLSDFTSVLNRRLQHQTGEKVLVLVCASGGGIQAAGWTVEVLTGLQRLLGQSFTRAIGLISAVSGGSVGTMYFLDRFDLQQGCPDQQDLDAIFESATRDSLDAVGWGLTYPDLARVIGVPFLVPPLCDRGTAVEVDWTGELQNRTATLNTWREQARRGAIPIPVFNATLVEDGRRFLISPLTFVDSRQQEINQRLTDFNTLYGNHDIHVTTAARLSATFPYISPICRSILEFKDKTYHMADGGYFDNSGVFTVVEWLNQWLTSFATPPIQRIVLLQINAFPKSLPSFKTKNTLGQGGWAMALLGPLLALFRVRDSTQTARNEAAIALLRQRWQKQGVEIRHVPIYFPSFEQVQQMEKEFDRSMQRPYFFDNRGKYDPPLSWKLTNAEKQAIKRAWERIAADPESEVQTLRQIWSNWGMEAANDGQSKG